ncbi:MAG: hypothetical protein LBQ87_06835, partial [Candidatus Fibromonas sp.]|nr:hypothetical protein [Candidatus Fibromonas sp.]
AVKAAIRSCISRKVLVEFLTRHGSEVENMLLTEWNMETALEVRYDEGVTKGVAIGEAIGMEKSVLRTARQMKAKGLNVALIAEVTGLLEEEIEGLDF